MASSSNSINDSAKPIIGRPAPPPPSIPPPPPLEETKESLRLSKRMVQPPPPSSDSFVAKRGPPTIPPPAPPPIPPPTPPPMPPPGPPPPFSDDDEDDDFAPPPPPPNIPPPPPPPPEFSEEEEEEEEDSYAPPPPSSPPPHDDEEFDLSQVVPPPMPPPSDEEDEMADYGFVAKRRMIMSPPPPPMDSADEYEEEDDELNTSGRSLPPPPPPVTVTSSEDDGDDGEDEASPLPRHHRRFPQPSISVSSEDEGDVSPVYGRPQPPPQPVFDDNEATPPPPTFSDDEQEHSEEEVDVPLPPTVPPPPSDDEDLDSTAILETNPLPPPPVDSEEENEPFQIHATPPPPVDDYISSEEEEPYVSATTPPPLPKTEYTSEEEEGEEEQQQPYVAPSVLPPPFDSDVEDTSSEEEEEKEEIAVPPPKEEIAVPPPKEEVEDDVSSLEPEPIVQESSPELVSTPPPSPPPAVVIVEDEIVRQSSPEPVQALRSVSPEPAQVVQQPSSQAAQADVPRPPSTEKTMPERRRSSTSHVPSSFFDPSSSSSEDEEEEVDETIIPPPFPPPPQEEDEDDDDATRGGGGAFIVEETYSHALTTPIIRTAHPIPERTLQQYAMWIDSLRIWPQIGNLTEAMKSGVLLCRLMDRFTSTAAATTCCLHANPKTKQMSLENIESALDMLWKQRISAANMPRSSNEVFSGNEECISKLLQEVFQVLGLPTAQQKMEMFDWYEGVLRHYDYVLPDSLSLPPHRGALEFFRSADALLCVLHFFCGPEGNREHGLPAVDLNRVCREAETAQQIKSNSLELFQVLESIDTLAVPWTVQEFLLGGDGDMLLVQLFNVYTLFQSMPCALPLVVPGGALPTSARSQYVMVGSHGEVKVMGVSFLLGEFDMALEPEKEEEHEAFVQPPPSSVFELQQQQPNNGTGASRQFAGFHSFSSDNVGEGFHSEHVPAEMEGEVFFLKGAFHAPLIMSESMNESALASMERALATSHHAAFTGQRNSASNLGGVVVTTQAMREKLRQRVAGAGNPILLLPSLAISAAAEDEKRANAERKAMQSEDLRRREFLRREVAATTGSRPRSLPRTAPPLPVVEDNRVQVAFDWLRVQRDVRFHYRNRRVSACRMFVTLCSTAYRLEWFAVNQPSEIGQVYFSTIDSIQTSGEDEDSFYLYIHLKSTNAGRAGGVLKIEPPATKQHDALRMFTNLNILLEDSKNGRANAKDRRTFEEF